jgi:hypothetical protein
VSGGDCSHSAGGSWLWLASLSKLRNAPNWSKLHGSHFIQETTIHFDSHFTEEKMSLQISASQLLKATVVSVISSLPYDLADVLVD